MVRLVRGALVEAAAEAAAEAGVGVSEHMDECVRHSWSEWGRERTAELGCDDPQLPEGLDFYVCHPWCPVLLANLAPAVDLLTTLRGGS